MNMLKKTLIAASLAAIGFAGHAQAQSQTDSDTFRVTLTVEGTCNAITASDIDFGLQSGIGDVDQTGTISVQCSRSHPYKLEIAPDITTNDPSDRRMYLGGLSTPSDYVSYQLSSDTHGGNTWGNSDSGAEWVEGIGQGLSNAVDHTVYGRATLTGNERPGAYRSNVTAILTF